MRSAELPGAQKAQKSTITAPEGAVLPTQQNSTKNNN